MSLKIFETVEFVNETSNVNVNQRLIKYSLFMKFVINNIKDDNIIQISKSIYDKSREIPAGALSAIFADPSFGFWLYTSKCIENRIVNNEIIPITDLPHLSFLNENDDLLYYHLMDFNRWLFAACLLSKNNFNGNLLIRDRKIYIPILGIVIHNLDKELIQNIDLKISENDMQLTINNRITIDISEIYKLAITGGHTDKDFENVYIIPSLLLNGGKILLDNEDPIITKGWSSIYQNPDGAKYKLSSRLDVLKNYQDFNKAGNLILEYWPEMAFNLSSVLQTIHIVESPYIDKHVSCTAANYFGAILVSYGNEFLLAEAIVHEYSHNILNMIIANGEMFEDTPPAEEIFYSPWRNDPRHISGLLHAVFVFNNVGKLLDKILSISKNEFVYERIINAIVKLIMGIEILKDYDFKTEFAKTFIKDLNDDINEFRKKYNEKDIEVQYNIQLEHLNTWITKNPEKNINNRILQYRGI